MPRYLLCFLLSFLFTPSRAQLADSLFYRHDIRLTVIQPGISYGYHFNKYLGVQASLCDVYAILDRPYPLTNNILIPVQLDEGTGATLTMAGMVRLGSNTHFLLGAGYRYFESPPAWTTATYGGLETRTQYYMSATSQIMLYYAGFDIHNSDNKRFSALFNIRIGISSGYYTMRVSDENYLYQGGTPARYDPSQEVPPFTRTDFSSLFYMNLGLSFGIRNMPHRAIPFKDASQYSGKKPASNPSMQEVEVDVPDSSKARHTLFGEVGGTTSSLFSANYEYRFKRRKKEFSHDISLRTGFSYTSQYFTRWYMVPILLNFTGTRNRREHLETGIGVTVGSMEGRYPYEQFQLSVSGTCMYRYQVQHRGFVFRAGWTPNMSFSFYGEKTSPSHLLMAGVSAGYTF